MRISLIALTLRALSAAAGAAAAELSQDSQKVPPTSPPEHGSTPDPGGATPAASEAADGHAQDKDGAPATTPPSDPNAAIAEAFRMAMAEAAAMPTAPRRKRKVKMPARYRLDGTIGPDWTCDELGGVLSQAGVMDALGINRVHVMTLEERGKLVRHLSNGKVCYLYEDVMRLAELVRSHQAGKPDAS